MNKVICIGLIAALPAVQAQQLPPIRPVGPIERVSTEALRSVTTVVPLSDGRVYVNDAGARRVLLFDSTLSHPQVVADSTSATTKAYGARSGTLIRFRGDSALFVDPASQSMLVLGPDGKIDRAIAMPQTGTGAAFQFNLVEGAPGFDSRGRLISIMSAVAPRAPQANPGTSVMQAPDSALLVGFDLISRAIDTIGSVRISYPHMTIVRDANGEITSITGTQVLLPVIDSWAIEHDGTVVAVRGRDFHVDRLGADGRWHASPKLPFAWEHLSNEAKTALIDSALATMKARRDSMAAGLIHEPTPPPPAGGGALRGRSGGGGGGPAKAPALIDGRPAPADLPDDKPAFRTAAARADADGNLWIKTTVLDHGQPLYDIVNAAGVLIDRLELPAFRTIAGFGPGVVYLAVVDPANVVHLERAAIRRK
jgi:hypothetical protein